MFSLRKTQALNPELKQVYMNKFSKTGSVKEMFIDKEGNLIEIFRPGPETRLANIGVVSITKHIKKCSAKDPIIDSVEIHGRVTEKKYDFYNSVNDNQKAKNDAYTFLRKGINARRAGFATTI